MKVNVFIQDYWKKIPLLVYIILVCTCALLHQPWYQPGQAAVSPAAPSAVRRQLRLGSRLKPGAVLLSTLGLSTLILSTLVVSTLSASLLLLLLAPW